VGNAKATKIMRGVFNGKYTSIFIDGIYSIDL
jgi:hypothetical protein